MLTRRRTLIILTLLWPAMLIVISFVRFGFSMFVNMVAALDFTVTGFLLLLSGLMSIVPGMLIFALIGWLSGFLLLAFMESEYAAARTGAVIGYIIVALPAAWFAIIGGLLFPLVGQALYGLSVIGIGVVVGWMFGLLFHYISGRFNLRV